MATRRLGCFLILIQIWLCSWSQPDTIVFNNGLVFDGFAMHEGWSVAIANTKIIYAGPSSLAPVMIGSTRIDLRGKTLLPGLIEGHSHLLLHPYNETSWNDQVLKESLTERALRAANHARQTLAAGFTTVRDLGSEGAEYVDVMLKKSIERGIIPGPRMIAAGRAIVATGSYGPKGFAPHVRIPLGAQEADQTDIVRVVRDQIGNGVDVVKVYADYRWGPFGQAAPTFSIEELSLMVSTAASSGRKVVAHAATEEGMRRAVLAGVATIEHGDGGTPEIFKLMYEHQVALCPTLAAGDAIMQYRGWIKNTEPIPERILQKKKSFKAALAAGVTICAGGDVGVFSHGDNVRELEMMVAYGMTTLEVLQSVTQVNALVFELSLLGQIHEGYLADMIVVDENPLHDISALRQINQVWKDGNLVFEAP